MLWNVSCFGSKTVNTLSSGDRYCAGTVLCVCHLWFKGCVLHLKGLSERCQPSWELTVGMGRESAESSLAALGQVEESLL